MDIYFKNKNHESLFRQFKPATKREKAVIYLLSSVAKSRKDLELLYNTTANNFNAEGYIIKDNLRKFDKLRPKDKTIIALAFNLFNNIDISKEFNLSPITPYVVYCMLNFSGVEYIKLYSTALELTI